MGGDFDLGPTAPHGKSPIFHSEEVYAIPNQEASTVAEALVTNFFCRFGIPRELYSDQGQLRSFLIQKVLQPVGLSKMCTTPQHPQSDGMVQRYKKTVEERLRKIVALPQRDWDAILPNILLAYMAFPHDTTGWIPASLVFGREPRLPCDLLFAAPPDKERPSINHAANIVDHLHDIHNYARQHLKLALTG
jgi:hypothetical protein